MDLATPSELVEMRVAALALYDEAQHQIPDATVLEQRLFTFQGHLKKCKPYLKREVYNTIVEDAAEVEDVLEEVLMSKASDYLLTTINTLFSDVEQIQL